VTLPLPGVLRGALSLLFFTVNTVIWILPLLLAHLLKLLVPARGWRRWWSRLQNGIATVWASVNNWHQTLTNPIRWDVEGLEDLPQDRWYVVMANHQSWADILVLQRIFNRRIPFLKFFLKRELFWVPLLGLAWWSLDYPFLKRSASARKDLETIRDSAAKFKLTPVSVMNFVEGTRFTPEKHSGQASPYRHLLKPKVGGLAYVLDAMRDEIDAILDVTIVYRQGDPNFWDFLCGRIGEVRVRVERVPVTPEMLGDFAGDKAFRRRFLTWLRELWGRKDRRIEALLHS
jgi:1-acyl-sn-glycerol-3-phosphate acyltransferase